MKRNNIKPEDFYDNTDYPAPGAKERVWQEIVPHVRTESRGFNFFEVRSFAFGFAAAVISFFFLTGVYFTAQKLLSREKPQNIILSETYSKAVDNFERALPVVIEKSDKETIVDELITVKREELDTLSFAIKSLKNELGSEHTSDIKYQRLVNLYRMKLKIIDSILELEEKRK